MGAVVALTVMRVLFFVCGVSMLNAGNAGVGAGGGVVAGYEYMGGTRGSCVVLEMSEVRWVRGIGGGWDLWLSLGCSGVGGVGGCLGPGCGMVRCIWQVPVSVYCDRRIPAHLRNTQCSILLHLIDIYFLPCICL